MGSFEQDVDQMVWQSSETRGDNFQEVQISHVTQQMVIRGVMRTCQALTDQPGSAISPALPLRQFVGSINNTLDNSASRYLLNYVR